mmetsp:Transcript_31529/g.38724  ORF Transcript_31529/g.38724 Transcript_31529/m.38724 type:complete len:217 (-) Transcript_31529:41-691(-)
MPHNALDRAVCWAKWYLSTADRRFLLRRARLRRCCWSTCGRCPCQVGRRCLWICQWHSCSNYSEIDVSQNIQRHRAVGRRLEGYQDPPRVSSSPASRPRPGCPADLTHRNGPGTTPSRYDALPLLATWAGTSPAKRALHLYSPAAREIHPPEIHGSPACVCVAMGADSRPTSVSRGPTAEWLNSASDRGCWKTKLVTPLQPQRELPGRKQPISTAQ